MSSGKARNICSATPHSLSLCHHGIIRLTTMLVSPEMTPYINHPEDPKAPALTAETPAQQQELEVMVHNRERISDSLHRVATHFFPPIEPVADTTPRTDLSDGLTLRQRWQLGGDTFPARILNGACRLAHRRTRLDHQALPFLQYVAERPRTVTERVERIRSALRPNLLLLQIGHLVRDVETGIAETLKELRSGPSSEE